MDLGWFVMVRNFIWTQNAVDISFTVLLHVKLQAFISITRFKDIGQYTLISHNIRTGCHRLPKHWCMAAASSSRTMNYTQSKNCLRNMKVLAWPPKIPRPQSNQARWAERAQRDPQPTLPRNNDLWLICVYERNITVVGPLSLKT